MKNILFLLFSLLCLSVNAQKVIQSATVPTTVNVYGGSADTAEVILPDSIFAVVGYTKQVFFKSIIKGLNPLGHNIEVFALGVSKGTKYPTYWTYTPVTADVGTHNFIVRLKDQNNNIISRDTAKLIITEAGTGPVDTLNVLCIGNSLTEAGTYVTELRRMLAASGGSPTGLSKKFKFLGTKGTAPNQHEGWSGKQWQWLFNDVDSPFTFGGNADFSQYMSTNHAGQDIDIAIILLGWNGIQWYWDADTWASSWTQYDEMQGLLDSLHADYPNCTIYVAGLQPPTPFLPVGYGDDDFTNLGNYYGIVQSVFGLNELYRREVATRSSYCRYLDTGHGFDPDYGYNTTTQNANYRATTTVTVQNGGVHPGTFGYLQMADCMFQRIVSDWVR